MQNAAMAYSQTAKTTRDPRELEASLLLKAASQMQNIKDNWETNEKNAEGVLLFNRKLWTIFVTSVTSDDNPLPLEIKNNIANLAGFIFSQTLSFQVRPTPEKLNSLITINREIAAGLSDG